MKSAACIPPMSSAIIEGMSCCVDCFSDEAIQKEIRAKGKRSGECAYCRGTAGPFIKTVELTECVRRVVDHFFCPVDELSQSPHVDALEVGETPMDLVQNDFELFSDFDKGAREVLLLDILQDRKGPDAEDNYSGRGLWAKRTDDWTHPSLGDLVDPLREGVRKYGHSLSAAKYFLSTSQETEGSLLHVRDLLSDVPASFKSHTKLWRARRGRWEERKDLGAPPPPNAVPGRGLGNQSCMRVWSRRPRSVR